MARFYTYCSEQRDKRNTRLSNCKKIQQTHIFICVCCIFAISQDNNRNSN